jgi:hypothetical protein
VPDTFWGRPDGWEHRIPNVSQARTHFLWLYNLRFLIISEFLQVHFLFARASNWIREEVEMELR